MSGLQVRLTNAALAATSSLFLIRPVLSVLSALSVLCPEQPCLPAYHTRLPTNETTLGCEGSEAFVGMEHMQLFVLLEVVQHVQRQDRDKSMDQGQASGQMPVVLVLI